MEFFEEVIGSLTSHLGDQKPLQLILMLAIMRTNLLWRGINVVAHRAQEVGVSSARLSIG